MLFRFDPSLNGDSGGLTYKSMLCMPIRDSASDAVLGVITLVNKENDGVFTENDERFVEAFSLFCGLAIRNAAAYEKAVQSEAKLQVAFDTMNYQASSTEEEARNLAASHVPSAAKMNLVSFQFNYLGLEDMDIFKVNSHFLCHA